MRITFSSSDSIPRRSHEIASESRSVHDLDLQDQIVPMSEYVRVQLAKYQANFDK